MEDDTLKKVVLHSVATALASMVLPVPGGPNMSTPCMHTNCHTSFFFFLLRVIIPELPFCLIVDLSGWARGGGYRGVAITL